MTGIAPEPGPRPLPGSTSPPPDPNEPPSVSVPYVESLSESSSMSGPAKASLVVGALALAFAGWYFLVREKTTKKP